MGGDPGPRLRPLTDRHQAGLRLAARLQNYAQRSHTVVLGLPRGGVPVAYEIAIALDLPLDIWPVRKLGVPGQAEFAMGAIAPQQIRVLNQGVIQRLHISPYAVAQVTRRESEELDRRQQLYHQGRSPLDLAGKTVILVDDGAATGLTLRAAIQSVQQQRPAQIVVALPVAAPAAVTTLERVVDELVCLVVPDQLQAVSHWYQNFDQTSDSTVCTLLAQSRRDSQVRTCH